MALDKLTKLTSNSGISTVIDYTMSDLIVDSINIAGGGTTLGKDFETRNLKVTGLSTFVGNVQMDGNLTVNGTTTTLDTNLIGVDRVEVVANNNNYAGIAVTQSGTGDIISAYDGSTQVFVVNDGNKVGIADSIYHIGDTDTAIGFSGANTFRVDTGGSTRLTVTDSATTVANNATFSGNATFNGNDNVLAGNYFDIQNNKKLRLGTNGDCAFYFNGAATLIETGNKIIHMQSDASIRLQKNDPQQHMLIANAGGSVDSYYSGSKKLETTTHGTKTTGIGSFTSNVEIAHGTGQAHYQITQTNGNTVKFGIVSGSDIELSGSSNNSMIFKTNGNNERFKIQGDGLKEIKNGRLRITSTFIDFSGNISTPSTGAAIFRPASDTLAVSTNNVERVRIDSNGHVGIGTIGNDIDSIGRSLNIASSTGGAIYLQDTDAPTVKFGAISYNGVTAGLQIHAHHSSSYIDLGTNGTERLRIGSSGGVGLSTTLIRNQYFMNIAAPSQAYDGASTNLMDGGGICFQGTDNSFATGRTYPGIFWTGNTAALGRARAGIIGRSASNNDATDIVFLTRSAANGTAMTPADERLRITSGGNILAGRTSDYWSSRAAFQEDKQGRTAILVKNDTNHADASSSIILNAYGNSWTMNCGSTARDSNSFTINQDATSNSNQGTERLRIDTSGRLLIGTTSGTQGQVTIKNANDFSTASVSTQTDNIFLISDATSGNNVYGASIGFSRVQYADRRAAAIATVQEGGDEDLVGLSFFTHAGTNATDPVLEKLRIQPDGRVGINTFDARFNNSNSASGNKFYQNIPKLGVQGSIVIGNVSSTATDVRELAFYRRGGPTPGTAISNHHMGRIAWYGSSNDTAFPDMAWSIECNPNGNGWTAGSNRHGYLSIISGQNGQYVRLTSSGYLGVGIATTPASRMHIQGNSDGGSASATLTIEDSDGTAGSREPIVAFEGGGTRQARIMSSDQTSTGAGGLYFGIGSSNTTALQLTAQRYTKIGLDTRDWATVEYKNLRTHCRMHYSPGNAVQTYTILRIRRHWWGWGSYKIRCKAIYYNSSLESVWYVNGHGSGGNNYSIANETFGGDASNQSWNCTVTHTASNNSPGSSGTWYADIKVNIPNYYYVTIWVEAWGSDYTTDPTTGVANSINTYCLM